MMAETATSAANVGLFGRACRGQHYSGDLAFVRESGANIFLAMVDVAGHGRSAHRVATEIESYLKLQDTDDLAALVQSLHRRLKGSRGAVMIAGILDTKTLDFAFVQIGDSHGRIFGHRRRSLIGKAGMLGQAMRTPEIQSEMLSAGDTLVLCTDGVSEGYDVDEIQGHLSIPTDLLARRIVEQFGKDHDDATCLVVRCA